MPKESFYNQESEQALLAAIMIEKGIYKQIDVTIDDFYFPEHQKMYECICEIMENGMEPDYVAVTAKVKAKGWEDKISPTYICSLAESIPGAITTQWKTYVSIIKEKSAVRQLNLLARQIEKDSRNGLGNIPNKIDEVMVQLIKIKEKAEGKRRGVTEQVKEWALTTSGNFLTTDLFRELDLTTRDNKKKAVVVLLRMEKDGLLAKCGKKRGCYRLIEADSPSIDFLSADISKIYDIKFPFDLQNYVHIYPKNIIVIAGASNAGKTAFLLNVVRLNMDRHKINYFSSEMGPEELKLRLLKFDDLRLKDWKFHPRERSTNFADAIVPDAINIIDYLEVTKDFYEVGGEIKGIFDRLNKGLALIAIQKKSGTDYGRGGEFTLEKPRLYLSMDAGTLKIVKGKNWAEPGVNPNGLTWTFKLVGGAKFIETGGTVWNLE